MSFQSPDLSGKAAIVTGASRGIGKELALGLARAGCSVTAAAKSVEPKEHLPGSIHETVEEIEGLGARGLAVRANVRDEEDIAAMVEKTVEAFGRLDFLIHNAGALWWRPVADTPSKRFDLVHQVNIRAAFLTSYHALPHLREAGPGSHILHIAPPIDFDILPGKVAYLLSKYSITMLAMGLAQEEREHGIAVNCLWPATAVESQATINHQMGTREQWRKPEIMSDAMLAIFGHGDCDLTGQALIDEMVLRDHGVTDFEPYNCVPGGQPLYLVGEKAKKLIWKERAGQIEGKS